SLAERRADGTIHLTGTAAGGARVHLASPDGASFGATVGPDGGWSFDLPPAASPRMFAVSAEADGETVRAEGALLVLPSPAPDRDRGARRPAGPGGGRSLATDAPQRALSRHPPGWRLAG